MRPGRGTTTTAESSACRTLFVSMHAGPPYRECSHVIPGPVYLMRVVFLVRLLRKICAVSRPLGWMVICPPPRLHFVDSQPRMQHTSRFIVPSSPPSLPARSNDDATTKVREGWGHGGVPDPARLAGGAIHPVDFLYHRDPAPTPDVRRYPRGRVSHHGRRGRWGE